MLHKTIKEVTELIEKLKFNVAVSKFMIFFNHFSQVKKIQSEEIITKIIVMLSTFAPHISEEILEKLGKNRVEFQQWPSYDEKIIERGSDRIENKIAVQVNGKLRDVFSVPKILLEDREWIKSEVLKSEKVKKHLASCSN